MLDAIYKFFGTILKGLNSFTGHYLLALLVLAVIIKVVFLPFGIKQQKNLQKQTKLKPKEMAIRNKYKGRTDQPTVQKMNQEIQQMYQESGYNGCSGCLPLLIQMPIIIFIYRVIMNPLQYISGVSAEGVKAMAEMFSVELGRGDITLLQYINETSLTQINALEGVSLTMEQIPSFDLFGMTNALANQPSFKDFSWLIIIPVITFIGQFLTSFLTRKLTPQPMMEATQQNKTSLIMMDIMMPALTTWIAFSVPAAIGLYWFFQNVLSLLQTVILKFAMPLPVITEEEIKAAEREYNQKEQKKKLNETKQKKSKYIDDDDDYDQGGSSDGPTRYDRD